MPAPESVSGAGGADHRPRARERRRRAALLYPGIRHRRYDSGGAARARGGAGHRRDASGRCCTGGAGAGDRGTSAGWRRPGCRATASVSFDGHEVTLREVPVDRAAVYVPGGRAPYPSTVVMGVITAKVAGVSEIAVCAPPGADGEVNAVVLGACRLAGATAVYRMGGAQAIAALAFGTETVAPVDVIVGPGQSLCPGGQAPGVRPGRDRRLRGAQRSGRDRRRRGRARARSGSTCSPRPSTGPGSMVVAISDSSELLDALETADRRRAGNRGGRAAGRASAELDQALAIAEAFAPEHLQLVGRGR